MDRFDRQASFISGMVKGIFIATIAIGLGVVAFAIFAALNPDIIGTWFGTIVSAFRGAIQ